MTDNELYHYGIKGMKWGVRRSEAQLAKARGVASKTHSDHKADSDTAKRAERQNAVKKRRTLSDAELKERIERIKLEKQLKDLTEEDLAPGKTFVSRVMTDSGKKAATTLVSGAMLYAVKVALEKEFNAKEMASYVAPKPKNK